MRTIMMLVIVVSGSACDDPAGPREPTVSTIEFTAGPTSIVPNEEATISVTAKDAAGAVIPSPVLEWSSDDTMVVIVSPAGVVKGRSPGSATIRATSKDVRAERLVTVDQGGFVGAAGGTISGFAGGVVLVVPPNALSAGTAIRFGPIAAPLPDPTFVRGSGGAVQFNGTFAVPAWLTLSYNAAERPTGLAESRLGLRSLANGLWTPLGGSTADEANDRVTGPITAPGSYGVGMKPGDAACTAAEHRFFDFRIGAFTWAGPAGLSGNAEIVAEPTGCSIGETLRITNGNTVRAVFFYEPANQQWHYTSIDGANTTRLSGRREGTRMVLYTSTGRTRVVWEELNATSHVQAGESSPDGVTFTRLGSGTYSRTTPAAQNVITPAGGRLVLAGGALTIDAPAGAVTQNVTVNVAVSPSGGPLDPSIVRGANYTLTPTPAVTLQQPLTLTLRYDPANGPSGATERDYRLARDAGNAWETLTGTADTTANTVTGTTTAFGTFTTRRAAPAQQCTAAEHRQFDFWVGEWDVGVTRSSITSEATGCAIFEHWQAQQTGRSISLYDPVSRQWHQTYVSGSNALIMRGGIENGRMVMYVRSPQGTLLQRWTWERVDANTVTQRSEGTADNGATWQQGFLGTYRRR